MPSDNLLFLADIQQWHQTKEAKNGAYRAKRMILKHGKHHPPSVGSGDGPASKCHLLAQKIHDIVKAIDSDLEEKITRLSTGLNWQIR